MTEKSEVRNPKPEARIADDRLLHQAALSGLEFRISFGFWISDFGFSPRVY